MSKSTRVLNISPKAQLAITDNIGSVYPSILRTGDERTLGNYESIYDDSGVQVFSKQNVLMPYNAEKKFIDNLGFLTGSIYLEKTPTPASQFLTPYKDEKYKPYDEARNQSSFFESGSVRNEGFDENLYQGFTSPISSKIAIPIDISYKPSGLAPADLDIKIAYDGVGGTTSPFVYYDFTTKTWDQIGTIDPATGNSTGYTHLLNGVYATDGSNVWIRGDNSGGNNVDKIVKQFTSSPGMASEIILGPPYFNSQGYDKIGYPTSFFEAPNAKKYHAKSSQTLKLSNYITSPFILEKIQVILPVKGTRYQNGDPKLPSFISGSGRDIDNHVFFIYRQNRTTQFTDTAQDVSSSIRALIGNESFCFYNRRSMPPGLGIGTYLTPIHENQLEVNYNALLTQIGTFTTDVQLLNMVFTPKTYEQQFTAASTIGIKMPNVITNTYIQNYWDGGQKSVEKYTRALNPYPTLPEAIRTIQARGFNQFNYTTSSGLNTPDYKYQIDPRDLRSSTFLTSSVRFPRTLTTYFDEPTSSTDVGYRKNLYVLFPEDELIFGIDAGLFPTCAPDLTVTTSASPPDLPAGYFDDITVVDDLGDPAKDSTGKLTIVRGDAKVILYGTMIKDNVELLGSLNQNLTSPSLHEAIHSPVTDQFQINETSLYSESYIANYITGTMSASGISRGVISTLAGTLSRASTHINFVNAIANNEIDPSSLNFGGIGFSLRRTDLKRPTSKFRYDKFGQFRDMLEQRRDTKSTEEILVSKNFSIPNFVKTFGSAPLNSPVMVSFVSQSSTTPALPIETRSGNLSFECTSSIPYVDDGIPRNRPDIVFGQNPPFGVQTIILGKGSSLLTTT